MGQAAETPRAAGQLDFSGGHFQLRFDWDRRLVGRVKRIATGRWDARRKVWTVQPLRRCAAELRQVAVDEDWEITPAAQKALDDPPGAGPVTRAHGAMNGVADALLPPYQTFNPFYDAQRWLQQMVTAYRVVRPGCADVRQALHELDELGYTPFGRHVSGDLGLATDPDTAPLRPSALSRYLNSRRRR